MEPIYCPKCGAQAADKQKFCRACGQDMLAVSALINGQTVVDQWKRGPIVWGVSLLLGGTALGSIVKVLSKQGINVAGELTPYLMVLALLMVFGGMGLIAYLALSAISPHRRAPSPATLPASTNRMPVALAEPPTTITERTTELIERDEVHAAARSTAPQTTEASER
jgi:hypothetical protein